MKYGKLLLSELRFVTYERSDAGLTDQLMAKAVTLNENLKSLGYTLCPADQELVLPAKVRKGTFCF